MLNEDLPEDKRIFYAHFDVKKSRKKKNFISLSLEYISSFLRQTGVFYTELASPDDSKLGFHIQRGVVRTNCIDSLDRTNLMQQLVGISALEKQLKVLKILDEDEQLQSWTEI